VTGSPVELVSTRTADGVLLQGAASGPKNARAGLLAVHGAWGNFYSAPPSELLRAGPARGLRALSLNLRSHDLGSLGDGEPCIGFVRHRVEDSAVDLDAALSLLLDDGVERVAVVAHSYGAHLAAYWLKVRRPPQVTAFVLASPAPPLPIGARWFVEGAVDHHLALATRAIAAGEPRRLLVLSSSAPVPMVAEAATVVNVWGRDTLARSDHHVGDLSLPMLVSSGRREPSVYVAFAEGVAEAAGGCDFELLDDDHYYAADRAGFAAFVLEWLARRSLP
jgi:pimeloyl-ACP methyl ester carboxylesterase